MHICSFQYLCSKGFLLCSMEKRPYLCYYSKFLKNVFKNEKECIDGIVTKIDSFCELCESVMCI